MFFHGQVNFKNLPVTWKNTGKMKESVLYFKNELCLSKLKR